MKVHEVIIIEAWDQRLINVLSMPLLARTFINVQTSTSIFFTLLIYSCTPLSDLDDKICLQWIFSPYFPEMIMMIIGIIGMLTTTAPLIPDTVSNLSQ